MNLPKQTFLDEIKKPQFLISASYFLATQSNLLYNETKIFLNPDIPLDQKIMIALFAGSAFNFAVSYKGSKLIYQGITEVQNIKEPRLKNTAEYVLREAYDFFKFSGLLVYNRLRYLFSPRKELEKFLDSNKKLHQSSLENVLKYYSDDSPKKDLCAAFHLSNLGNHDEALGYIKSWIQKFENNPNFRRLIVDNSKAIYDKENKGKISIYLNKKLKKISKKKNNKEDYLNYHFKCNVEIGLSRASSGDLESAKIYFNHIAEQLHNFQKPDLHTGLMLHALGEEEKSLEIIKKAILANPDIFKQAPYFTGSKKARQISDSLFGKILMILEDTKVQLNYTLTARDVLESKIKKFELKDTYSTFTPLGFLKSEDKHDLNNSKTNLQSLEQLAIMYIDGPIQKLVYVQDKNSQIAGLKALGFFQAAMTNRIVNDDKGIIPYMDQIQNRLENDKLLPSEIKNQIIDNIEVCFKLYSSIPKLVYDGDRSPYQAIMIKTKEGYKTIFLDLEKQGIQVFDGYNRPESDDAKNLFHGKHLLIEKANLQEHIKNLIRIKNKEFNKFAPRELNWKFIGNEQELYIASVMATAIAKAISYNSYTNTLANPKNDNQEFLDMVLITTPMLTENFKFIYTNKDLKKFNYLIQALEKLKEVNLIKMNNPNLMLFINN